MWFPVNCLTIEEPVHGSDFRMDVKPTTSLDAILSLGKLVLTFSMVPRLIAPVQNNLEIMTPIIFFVE